ncbi:MAG: TolC family protein [Candidatus Omnitrophota bacterium]|jgi:outer membrane protein TolC
MNKIIAYFLIVFLFLPSLCLGAEEGISLALDEAVAIALRDNRDILLKAEDVKKAQLKIAEANAALFPTLDFTGSWTDTRGLYPKDISKSATQATLKQYLYQGGKIVNTIKQNRDEFEVSLALLDKAKLETILTVKKAFYTLILADEFTGLNEAILSNTREHLKAAEARYLTGEVSQSDILRLQESLSSVESAYEASLNQAESSRAVLNNLLSLDKDVKIIPEGEFSYEPREVIFDEAFLRALEARPEIRQYLAQEKADKRAIEIAKSDNRPSIYASWDYYSQSTSTLSFSPIKGWQDYNIVGLTFSWPLFDGWATKAKVEQAIVDLKATQLNKGKVIGDIALELKNAYLALKNATSKLRAAEADITLYQDRVRDLTQKYSKGIASELDKQDADLSYRVALFNQKESIYDYIVAKDAFDKATGGM